MSQAHYWSEAASDYETLFIDPYAPETDNPLPRLLEQIPNARDKVVADLGCGTGPLLPLLARTFREVHAIDFAPGMLARARQRVTGAANVQFHQADLTQIGKLGLRWDVAVAVNSLVLPELSALQATLAAVKTCLNSRGRFYAVLPAMDGIQYHTMLLNDLFLEEGMSPSEARAEAARLGEHQYYDFTWSHFRYLGLEQHFWQPHEIAYRFERAGFVTVRRRKLRLPWNQVGVASRLSHHPAPWDWLVRSRVI